MPTKQEGYRFLEHTTDALIEAWGPTLERAFAEAAKGFFDTMINFENVNPSVEEVVDASGHDEPELLYNWLEELLLRFELRGMAYSTFDIEPISQTSTSFQLRGKARGEHYDPAKHGAKTAVKAVTYHMMTIEREAGEVRVRFLLDL